VSSSPLGPDEVKFCPVFIFSSLCPPKSSFYRLLYKHRIISSSNKKFKLNFLRVSRKYLFTINFTYMFHKFSISSLFPFIKFFFIIPTRRFLFPNRNFLNFSSNYCLRFFLRNNFVFENRGLGLNLLLLLLILGLNRF